MDDKRTPIYWECQSYGCCVRADGVRVDLAYDLEQPLFSPPVWLVSIPKTSLPKVIPLPEASTVYAALKVVDRRWAPPGWVEVPDWWLGDLEILAMAADT